MKYMDMLKSKKCSADEPQELQKGFIAVFAVSRGGPFPEDVPDVDEYAQAIQTVISYLAKAGISLMDHPPAIREKALLLEEAMTEEANRGDRQAFGDTLREWCRLLSGLIECPYRGKLRKIHPAVCRWHREEGDPECSKCGCERIILH